MVVCSCGHEFKANAITVMWEKAFKKEEKKVDNDKVVKAVATVKALSDEEYVLVLALTARAAAPKVRKPRKKTRGLPEAQAEGAKVE